MLSIKKITSSFLPVYTDITWVTLSLKKHYFPSPACTRSCHKSDTVCKKNTTALLPACTVTQVTLSLKKHITSPLLPAHIEVTWVTLYKTSLLLSCLCTQMSLEKVERQGLIKKKKSSPVHPHWCHTSDNVFITDIIIINVWVHCTQLYCHQYLVADADQTIVET